MTNQEYLSWFIGFMEGEGTAHHEDKIKTSIIIANTEVDLIDICTNILDSQYIKYSRLIRYHKNPKYKTLHILQIGSRAECFILIKTLGKYFQCRYNEFMTKLNFNSIETNITLLPDLYWLIGLFEAEGCFCISKTKREQYQPSINIGNTNQIIIEKVAKTLRNIGCAWKSSSYQSSKPNRKKVYHIKINTLYGINNFLSKTIDLFISHKYCWRAKLLLEFVQLGRNNFRKEYTERQDEIYELLKLD